jgi:hypothetical protein
MAWFRPLLVGLSPLWPAFVPKLVHVKFVMDKVILQKFLNHYFLSSSLLLVDCRTGSLHLGPCIRALCAPHWNSFLPSSTEALRTHQRERPLLAREGNWREFSHQPVIHRRSWDFWHTPNLGHWTDYFTSPPKESMLRIFSYRNKSSGFGRVRTRELGNQRPAC